MNILKIYKTMATAILLASSLSGYEPMEDRAGFSGFVILGTKSGFFSSSEIIGNRYKKSEKNTIGSYNSPNHISTIEPVFSGELKYTLDDKKTEIALGHSEHDVLRLDSSFDISLRHKYDGYGIVGFGLLSSVLPNYVWQDPLLKNSKRKSTKRTSYGVAMTWEGILSSNFDIEIKARKLKFENDKNGFSQTGKLSKNGSLITNSAIGNLKRDATNIAVKLSYNKFLSQTSIFVPSFRFINSDADGDSRTYNVGELKFEYKYFKNHWIVNSAVYASQSFYKKQNPIFNKKQDTFYFGGNIDVFYLKPFDLKDWGIFGNISYAKGESKIDFYDVKYLSTMMGISYNF